MAHARSNSKSNVMVRNSKCEEVEVADVAEVGGAEEGIQDEERRGQQQQEEEDNAEEKGTPIRYVPLCDLYSATSPCVSGSSKGLMSKKVKARKLDLQPHPRTKPSLPTPPPSASFSERPAIVHVYSRRARPAKRPRHSLDSFMPHSPSGFNGSYVKQEQEDGQDNVAERLTQKKKYGREGSYRNTELIRLGVESGVSALRPDGPRLRELRLSNPNVQNCSQRKRKRQNLHTDKNWVRLSFDGVDPEKFIGLQCKVYWPLDADWYTGYVAGYNAETVQHQVVYDDGDKENIILSNERIEFCVSHNQMQSLNLSCSTKASNADGHSFSEMVVMAATLGDSNDFGTGDIIWAKITGHAMWPAIVVDESLLKNCKGLGGTSGEKSVPVQFFGTHDFARVKQKQVIAFLRGLISNFHEKCKKPHFFQSLEEAKLYLSEQKLPKRMLRIQNGIGADDYDSTSQENEGSADTGDDCIGNAGERTRRLEGHKTCPFESGDSTTQRLFGLTLNSGDQELSNLKLHSKSLLHKSNSQRLRGLPIGYRPVHVEWRDLDKCNVCHMDEEYENNVFLQCDKCRMMVHAKCYGETEPVDGILWFCNLCRPGAPEVPPACCLCPVTGGAMKPTTDGRWAHLSCAIWIPETCLSDIKKMEPIDGLSRIHKDRWKLLCSICGVSYGACIQCSNNTCRVAYHPLCARAAGFCVELEDEDKLHLISMDEDEDEQCIRLLSFCKKHRPPSIARLTGDDRIVPMPPEHSDYCPPLNPSGCARTEPYNYFGRRGRKEPEALAAASLKRLFVENIPYLVRGHCQHAALGNTFSTHALAGYKFYLNLQKLNASQLDAPKSIFSMAEKYKYMKDTFRKRLTFGKSGIHGFGIFARQAHSAGDMVIEYTGELVRAPVADRREHLIYNSLVGAGTYMFRIDDERVIDATRAGSIAHLINHSCENVLARDDRVKLFSSIG
ncbi:histone-lysine N-methyltransferase ATX2 isoform X2 [Diospyros lotus]|uniref:histone-lysine N-methyltransferase ATX2 isoform X2 n=1 Tax=Diospyros lotus TaxID=55363 RepID=UPI002253BDA6|nr:histone-lysine N-methyltransferase ATX2 isoform X2 [Diospyros lotus]